MLTVTFSRDGRTWYGRKLYKVTLKGEVGFLANTRLTRRQARDILRKIGHRLIIENRPHTYEGGPI